MWRSALVVLLLAGSPALAGQARGVMQVGITITGTARPPAKAATSGASDQTAAGALGGARTSAVKSSVRARPRPPQ